MVANLIGYMYIGPKHITADQKTAATERAWEIFRALWKWHADDEESGTPEMPDILDGLEMDEIYEACDLESLEFHGVNFTVADRTHVEATVAEIVEFWNDPDSHRDSVYRDVSDTEKAVFCGEMSWGGEPFGYGYLLFKIAHVLDILKPLGIH